MGRPWNFNVLYSSLSRVSANCEIFIQTELSNETSKETYAETRLRLCIK